MMIKPPEKIPAVKSVVSESYTTITSLYTITQTSLYETKAPYTIVMDKEGEYPSDISKISFEIKGEILIIRVEVAYIEGFAYPYTYVIFLSDNDVKGKYCILFKPWPEREVEGILVRLEDYSLKNLTVIITGRETMASVPLDLLTNLFPESKGSFYMWAYSWAYAFVPIERIEDSENIYMFDTVPVENISFIPIKLKSSLIIEHETLNKQVSIHYLTTHTTHYVTRSESRIDTFALWFIAALLLSFVIIKEKKYHKLLSK